MICVFYRFRDLLRETGIFLVLFLGFLELHLWEPWSVYESHTDFQCEQLVQNFATYTRKNTVFT